MHIRPNAYLLAAALPFLAACGGDDERPSTVVTTQQCATLAECPISELACQRAILEITACVRGDDAPALPKIRSISREQLRVELEAPKAPNAMVDEPDEGAQRTAASFEQAFGALQLVTRESTLGEAATTEQLAYIAAFYREDERDITVISDTTMNRATAMNALAHEFTHYLQDEAGQLELALDRGVSVDERMARRALIEGEAVVTSYRASAQMMGFTARNVRWDTLFFMIESDIASATNASKSPLLAALNQLPYVLASRALQAAWEVEGRRGVDGFFDQPPLTELDWLSGRTGADPSQAEPLDCYPPLAPSGFGVAGMDSLGVLGVYALLGTQRAAALSAASVWRGDALVVYRAQTGDAVLAVWRLRFRDEGSASRFATSLAPLQLSVTRFGRELAISVSSDSAQPPIGAEALATCPSVEQLGESSPALARSMTATHRGGPGSRFQPAALPQL